jgi:pimeloyl-ACP methyl ester carboxylesterase
LSDPTVSTLPTKRVLCVHGFMAPHSIMSVLAKRLNKSGFAADVHAYNSTRGSIDEHTAFLGERVRAMGEEHGPIWIVGHSLGGLLARLALARSPDLLVEGMVLIASPMRGCLSARKWAGWSAARRWLGPSLGEMASFPSGFAEAGGRLGRPVGVIAGGTGTSAGFRAALPGDNDGTVRVAETLLDDARWRAIVRVRHNLLPFSRRVAALVQRFMREQSFEQVPGVLRVEGIDAPQQARRPSSRATSAGA